MNAELGSPKSHRSAETRAKLLAAAGPIFAQQGWQRVTVREICQRAGVNIAAINYHFGDKQGLYLAVVRHARERRAERFPFPKWSADVSAEQRLGDFVHTILSRLLSPDAPWQTRLLMREVLQPSEACRTLVEDYFRPDFELLVSIVMQLLPPGCSLEEGRQAAVSVMGQCVVHRVAGKVLRQLIAPEEFAARYDVDSIARHVTAFSIAGCRYGFG